jgi:hypothetical protein
MKRMTRAVFFVTVLTLALLAAVAAGLHALPGAGANPADKMYWGEFNPSKIQRANLDGSGVEDLVTGLTNPIGGIALDLAPLAAPVGGIAELPDAAGSSIDKADSPASSPASSIGDYIALAALAGLAGAALVTLTAGGWYARRRWIR